MITEHRPELIQGEHTRARQIVDPVELIKINDALMQRLPNNLRGVIDKINENVAKTNGIAYVRTTPDEC